MIRSSVLLVEDSTFFSGMLKRALEWNLGFDVALAESFAEAKEILAERTDFLAALLDVTLPDSNQGEIVAHVTSLGIPSIIFTGGFDGKMRNNILSHNIVDYVLKDNRDSIEYIVNLLKRLHKNADIRILVADDSQLMRSTVVRLLQTHRFQTLEAEDGQQALDILAQNPDIRLLITDYEMPNVNGFELIKTIRETRKKKDLAVIGMSASDSPLLSARLLKNGANDFLSKPFQMEEFYCRINHNVEMLELIDRISEMSYSDELTGLANRRSFFERGGRLLADAVKANQNPVVIMADIDHFKKVNDTYGHDAGDTVLRQVAQTIRTAFPGTDMAARMGGEEFAVLTISRTPGEAVTRMEALHNQIAALKVHCGEHVVQVTISAGICSSPGTLDEMLKTADRRLYEAKTGGRNRVVS